MSEFNIDPDQLNELAKLNPFKSVTALIIDWLVIFFSIFTSLYFETSKLVYFISICVIGSRMHALAILLHEGAHGRFLNNIHVSDWVIDLTAGWPLLVAVQGYRKNHLAHHKFLNTKEDPDYSSKLKISSFHFPRSLSSILIHCVGYICVIFTLRDMFQFLGRFTTKSTISYQFTRTLYYVCIFFTFWYYQVMNYFVLYWLVPYLTIFFTLMYIRSVAEHFGSMDYSNQITGSRTVIPTFFESLFIAPHNVNYHLDHHLYARVPFYNLPKLHDLLMQNPKFRSVAHITHGYFTGVIKECLC